MLRRVVFLLIGCLATQMAPAEVGDTMHVRDAWVRDVPPVASSTAAYMVIDNRGQTMATLTEADSPYFEDVQLHKTVEEAGMARMVRQDHIEIGPGASLTMEPGGYHMMLIGFKQRVKAGDSIPIKLVFESGDVVELSVPVKESAVDAMHHHHPH